MNDNWEMIRPRDAARDWRPVLSAWVVTACLGAALLLLPAHRAPTPGYDPGVSHGLALGAGARTADGEDSGNRWMIAGEPEDQVVPANEVAVAAIDPAPAVAAPCRTAEFLHAVVHSVGRIDALARMRRS